MDGDTESVWVHLDVVRANQSTVYRGRLAASDLEAITSGGFTTPFVRLDDVHWVEVLWDERAERRELKVTALGRDGQWCHCAGPVYLRPDTIATVVPLDPDYGIDYRRGALALPTRPGASPGGSFGRIT